MKSLLNALFVTVGLLVLGAFSVLLAWIVVQVVEMARRAAENNYWLVPVYIVFWLLIIEIDSQRSSQGIMNFRRNKERFAILIRHMIMTGLGNLALAFFVVACYLYVALGKLIVDLAVNFPLLAMVGFLLLVIVVNHVMTNTIGTNEGELLDM